MSGVEDDDAAGSWSTWTAQQRWTVIATGLGVFMIVLDALIVNVALPDLQQSFGVGESGLQWVVAGYSIGMAVLMMASATLADAIGRRRTYVGGLAVFAVGSLVSGIAPALGLVTAARFVQGGAAATVSVASLALISNAFPEPGARVRAIGCWTAITSVGTALGPTLGGVLTEALGWRSVFLVNIPVAVVAIALTLRWVRESKDPSPGSLDRLGQVTFAVAVGAASYVIIEGQDDGWASPTILGLLVVALAAIAARLGARLPVLAGQALVVAGLLTCIVGLTAGMLALAAGLVLAGAGVGLIVTPITGIAMGAASPDRAGMASGILSTQRAIGSIAGYAVMGAVLAGWLGASLDDRLEPVIAEPAARAAVADEIVDQANPHAYAAEVGPGRPLATSNRTVDGEILDAAVDDFATGTRLALGVGVVLMVGAAGAVAVSFPRRDRAPDERVGARSTTGQIEGG